MRRTFLRLITFFRSGRADADLTREIDAHLQLLEEQFIARGMSADDAHYAARRAFGGQLEQTKERQRDARSFRVLDQWWLDVKLAIRMLVRFPGLTLVSVLGMSVAITIAAGGFSIFGMLLNPTLPLHEGDRIVSLQNWDVANTNAEQRSLHDFVTWRDSLTAVEDVGAFRQVGRNLIIPGVQPEVVAVVEISASGFRVTRVAPLLGRYLLDDDEREGAPPVVVIGHEVWKTRFMSDPAIIGRPLQLGSTTHTIVGVMPEGFVFPIQHHYWVPFIAQPERHERLSGPAIYIFGRLAPNATIETAQAEIATVGQQTSARFPATHQQLRPQVLPYTYSFSDMDDPENALAIRIMQYLVSLLLVIVCINVAILVYARTATRHAEIAVRSALGAGRKRIVAQLFIEALALSVLSAVLALGMVEVGLQQVHAALLEIEDDLPFWMDLHLSTDAVVYTFFLAVIAAAIVGVVPALKATGPHVEHRLKDVSAGGGAGMRLGRMWTGLIVAQVAIAVALLPTTVYHAWYGATYGSYDPRIPADEILTAQLVLDAGEVSTADATFRSRFLDRQQALAQRLAAEPQVSDVTFASHHVGQEARAWIEAEGMQTPTERADYRVELGSTLGYGVRINNVDDKWFEAFGVPLLAGRTFSGSDVAGGATPVIVNRRFVDDVLDNQSAVGRRIRYVGISGQRTRPSADGAAEGIVLDRWYEIVGVVDDVHDRGDSSTPNAIVYHPLTGGSSYPALISIRVRHGDPIALSGRLRELSAAIDPNLQLRNVSRMDDLLRLDQSMFRLIATGLVVLTLSVVILSAAGIYALMSCTVEQRRKEIGIRAALGADSRRILGAIFARASLQLGSGAVIGAAVAMLLENASGGELMAGHGRVILPIVSALMIAVGLLAAWSPARRGLSIHPIDTLRTE